MSTTTRSWRNRLPERVSHTTGLSVLAVLAVVVYLGGLELTAQLDATQFENASDPMNAVVMLAYILTATGAILAARKFGLFSSAGSILKTIVTGGVVALIALWMMATFAYFLPAKYILLAPALGFGIAAGLQMTRHWVLQNIAAVCVGILFIGVWGQEFGLFPALLLLVLLLVYDAISVYVTGHMETLADTMLDVDLALPAILVVPLRLDELSSFRVSAAKLKDSGSDSDAPAQRVALGTGDIVIPGILVVSAAVYAPAPAIHDLSVLNVPALTTILGILAGYVGLHRLLSRGGAHAGLPWLNGGAIAGYLAGALLSGIPLATALGLRAVTEVAI